jgi:DNA modification methylase
MKNDPKGYQNTSSKLATVERKLAIEYTPIEALRLDPRNPRQHSPKQIRQIAVSIDTFGFIVPVLVDALGMLLAGHGRLLAAQSLGMTQVPTIMIEHLNESQIRAFMIADNRLTENAEWDQQLLAEQLKTLSDLDLNFSVEVTGFEMGEIDVMVEGLAPAHDGQEDPADSLPEIPENFQVSRSGDLWTLGRHRIVCCNALDASSYQALLQGHRPAMVFTDPPYNVPISGHATGLGKIHHRGFKMASGEMGRREFTEFLTQALTHLAEHSKDGSLHFICMDWRHIGELLAAGRQVYSELKNLCVWVKDNGGMGSLYRSQHELVFVFKNGQDPHRNNVQLGQYGRYRTNVWHYPGVNSFSRNTDEGNLLELHPTVKPVAMVADAILDCTARKDIVLDPFVGSGTTIIAAERTGRICYGIEIDPVYVDTTIRRWQAFTGHQAVNATSGKTFNELEREVLNG